ncbi:hypothetical protein [Streptacidiphilus jiangxiensis]|uniref:Uncharacterized protein n=1 Tax=Streptacidiphilus jiangxiensis TaxID=235985 RepID=A0A1H7Z9J5_STRJI|nr:hypothetical protein [Streptacidiphilus jiangxiensis]SEM54881.1 hypothetical protein SAMN05414137_13358 [Streptacidiphilus jiangxiensis]
MIFKKRTKDSGLEAAVAELEQGVAERDPERTERAFGATLQALRSAPAGEGAPFGERLAALIPDFPPVGPRPMLAMMAGFCVEQGADPAACAKPILAGVHEALLDVLEFAERWRAGDPDAELPEPDGESVDEAALSRLGDDRYEALRLASAWTTLDEWQPPALAVLCRSVPVRRAAGATELPELVRAVAELKQHDLKCLAYALEVLDDEPLVVLHRASGAGFELRIGGIGDNFQLHTLLAHVLIGGGHLPGQAPDPRVVALSLDAPFDPGADLGGLHATGPFNLVAPDGSWIWNEGNPADIPVVDGRRLLVLDPPPYQRGWNVGRFFPMMTASIGLTRVLPPEEAQAWFRHVAPARAFGSAAGQSQGAASS